MLRSFRIFGLDSMRIFEKLGEEEWLLLLNYR